MLGYKETHFRFHKKYETNNWSNYSLSITKTFIKPTAKKRNRKLIWETTLKRFQVKIQ